MRLSTCQNSSMLPFVLDFSHSAVFTDAGLSLCAFHFSYFEPSSYELFFRAGVRPVWFLLWHCLWNGTSEHWSVDSHMSFPPIVQSSFRTLHFDELSRQLQRVLAPFLWHEVRPTGCLDFSLFPSQLFRIGSTTLATDPWTSVCSTFQSVCLLHQE